MKPVYKKILYSCVLILLGLLLLCVILFYFGKPKTNIVWGVTFSSIRAEELGFVPKDLLHQILIDLHPQIIRLPADWAVLEPKQNQFDFSLMDGLLAEAQTSHTKIVLVLGNKQPRWPECHAPQWFKDLNPSEQEAAILNMIDQTINHFKANESISAWQLENEPFFQYGPNCPSISSELFKKELAEIKRLDTRPIIATDSGEKGLWVNVASAGIDTLGATMYREAYYEKSGKYITYPLPWWTYNIKAGLVKLLSGKPVIGVELQAEPWLKISDPKQTPPAEQLTHMNASIFDRNIEYATKVGFSENYLWGAEWWYWLEKTNGDSSMINAAKKLFNK